LCRLCDVPVDSFRYNADRTICIFGIPANFDFQRGREYDWLNTLEVSGAAAMAKKSSSVSKAVNKTGKVINSSKQNRVKTFSRNGSDHAGAGINRLLTQARDLAWAGQHAKAIEICTQALASKADWQSDPQLQLDLLDTRAESYIAQLELDTAEKDAALMVKLAKAENKPALKAQALIRKGVVLWFQRKNESSIRTLTSALKLARQSQQKHLEAESLFRLADAQTGEQAINSAQQATDLFTSLADPLRIGRALAILANAYRFA
jgi:hypothetical protein